MQNKVPLRRKRRHHVCSFHVTFKLITVKWISVTTLTPKLISNGSNNCRNVERYVRTVTDTNKYPHAIWYVHKPPSRNRSTRFEGWALWSREDYEMADDEMNVT
jgi:hypothetical protein